MIAPAAATVVAPAAPAPAGAAATAGNAADVDPRIQEAAKGFEALFMRMLVDEMFTGTELASAQPLYGGMMTSALADSLAESGGVGLAAMLTRQLGGGA